MTDDLHGLMEKAQGLLQAGKPAEAEPLLWALLEERPNEWEVRNCLANVLNALGRPRDAVDALSYNHAIDPQDVQTHIGMGQAYDRCGDDARARFHYEEALRLDPHCATAHQLRAFFCLKRGDRSRRDWETGLAGFEWGRAFVPGGPLGVPRPTRTLQSAWDGRPIPGKRLYVAHEQGHGDAIMFWRFLPLVRERSQAASIVVEMPTVLVRLFLASCPDWADSVVAMRPQGAFASHFDEYVFNASLPFVLGVGLEDVGCGAYLGAASAPYSGTPLPRPLLDAARGVGEETSPQPSPWKGEGEETHPASFLGTPPEAGGGGVQIHLGSPAPLPSTTRREVGSRKDLPRSQSRVPHPESPTSLREGLGGGDEILPQPGQFGLAKSSGRRLVVGVCWKGSDGHPGDRSRSIAWEEFKAVTECPGVEFVSLQFGPAAAAAGFEGIEGDFLVTARRVAGCDLVVTVDTSIAHLAGAMGVPVWNLIAYDNDWRWFQERTDSPWYPSMRLFRQTSPGDWASVIARVKEELSGYDQTTDTDDNKRYAAGLPGNRDAAVAIQCGQLDHAGGE